MKRALCLLAGLWLLGGLWGTAAQAWTTYPIENIETALTQEPTEISGRVCAVVGRATDNITGKLTIGMMRETDMHQVVYGDVDKVTLRQGMEVNLPDGWAWMKRLCFIALYKSTAQRVSLAEPPFVIKRNMKQESASCCKNESDHRFVFDRRFACNANG